MPSEVCSTHEREARDSINFLGYSSLPSLSRATTPADLNAGVEIA